MSIESLKNKVRHPLYNRRYLGKEYGWPYFILGVAPHEGQFCGADELGYGGEDAMISPYLHIGKFRLKVLFFKYRMRDRLGLTKDHKKDVPYPEAFELVKVDRLPFSPWWNKKGF